MPQSCISRRPLRNGQIARLVRLQVVVENVMEMVEAQDRRMIDLAQ